jgi:hypothetical protein
MDQNLYRMRVGRLHACGGHDEGPKAIEAVKSTVARRHLGSFMYMYVLICFCIGREMLAEESLLATWRRTRASTGTTCPWPRLTPMRHSAHPGDISAPRPSSAVDSGGLSSLIENLIRQTTSASLRDHALAWRRGWPPISPSASRR